MKPLRSLHFKTILASCSLGVSISGCGSHNTVLNTLQSQTVLTPASGDSITHKYPVLTSDELKKIRPNEDGEVPILEYHNVFLKSNSPYSRTVAGLKNDLNFLYKLNYRPISMRSYLDNRINIPAGKSPVILSFDDADASQFQYLPNGEISPNCAVGVLIAFHKLHPDWRLRGIFFVLPDNAFGRLDERSKKLNALLKMGFEIGNHTITHPQLSKLSSVRVQWELAQNVARIKVLAPKADDDVLALPYGVAPRNRKLALSGSWNGLKYHNRAVMLAGAQPAPAVIDKKFRAIAVPRVQPVPGKYGMVFWLKYMQEHPGMKYISDGNPKLTTIPKSCLHNINRKRLNGAKLRVY